jgi:hypothetical protein
MASRYPNSLDKIIGTYFAGVTAESFTYKDVVYQPKPLIVSPDIFRGFTCPAQCGGCCFHFSLEYLPQESRPYEMSAYDVNFSGWAVPMFHDVQDDHDDHFCRNLDKKTGRCGIHGKHPFSCDFELLRFTHFEDKAILSTRLYGRGWAFTRIDGTKRAMCEIIPGDRKIYDDIYRRLTRLKEWTDHFQLKTHLPSVLKWVKSGPHQTPLVCSIQPVEPLVWG